MAAAIQVSRRMWESLEPVHAVVYWAPECRAATDALGATGGWMSYFALRAAPLGAVPAAVVCASFYNFHPARVARAIPDAWSAASPQAYLDARAGAVDLALRRMLGDLVDSPDMAQAAALARAAALAAPTAGRPLGAANAALPWPTQPHLVLWQAQTVLRESRGDGHVAALVAAGLDPCEALVAFAAQGRAAAESLRGYRGWSSQEWAAAADRLRARGLLDPTGSLTTEGADLRRRVEEATDRLAAPSWTHLGETACDRLVDLTTGVRAALRRAGAVAADNPIGLPLPTG